MAEDSVPNSKCIRKSGYNEELVFKSCSSTQVKVVKFRHTWSISNFSFCYENTGQELISATFSVGSNNDVSDWHFILYPKGKSEDFKNCVSLFLQLDDFNLDEIATEVKLGIVKANGKDHLIGDTSHRFTIDSPWGYNEFLKQDYLVNVENGALLDDQLTMFCDITAILGNESHFVFVPTMQRAIRYLANDLAFLLENKEFCDVTLVAGGKEFKAHKLILSARSSVFRAMFDHDMLENRNNRVEIIDIDEEELCEMLRYVYTGRISKLKKMAPRLLCVAEKYAMGSLKVMCEKTLLKSLSLDNAADIFILSDTFNTSELKAEVKNFIAVNASDVGTTTGFHSMIRTHPHLAIETFCAIPNSSVD